MIINEKVLEVHEWLLPDPISEESGSSTWQAITDIPLLKNHSPTHFELEIEWRDQGDGEKKGGLRIELVRNGTPIAELDLMQCPHEKRRDVIKADIVCHYDILGFAQTGDHFRLSYMVGDSIFDEEHELYIFFIKFKFWAQVLSGK